MSLSPLRKNARINAIRTAAEYVRSFGEEGSDADEHQMSDEEYNLFLEECQKLAKTLEVKADKLQFN